MSRRRAPRRAASAVEVARSLAAPKTPLAAAQGAWEKAVGASLADRALPVAEREGVLTVECADAVWAEELNLMQVALLEALRAELGELAPESLRFRVNAAHF